MTGLFGVVITVEDRFGTIDDEAAFLASWLRKKPASWFSGGRGTLAFQKRGVDSTSALDKQPANETPFPSLNGGESG